MFYLVAAAQTHTRDLGNSTHKLKDSRSPIEVVACSRSRRICDFHATSPGQDHFADCGSDSVIYSSFWA
jgi:hypothetical protein